MMGCLEVDRKEVEVEECGSPRYQTDKRRVANLNLLIDASLYNLEFDQIPTLLPTHFTDQFCSVPPGILLRDMLDLQFR